MNTWNIWVLRPTTGGLRRQFIGDIQARTENAAVKIAAARMSVDPDTVIARQPETDSWWRPNR